MRRHGKNAESGAKRGNDEDPQQEPVDDQRHVLPLGLDLVPPVLFRGPAFVLLDRLVDLLEDLEELDLEVLDRAFNGPVVQVRDAVVAGAVELRGNPAVFAVVSLRHDLLVGHSAKHLKLK